MRRIDWDGTWWFRESPTNKYAGKLVFDSTNPAVLSLEGHDDKLLMLRRQREKFFILGETSDGVKVSLWINYISEYTPKHDFENNCYIIYCAFVIDYIFAGDHLLISNINDILISSISIKFSGLDKWIYSSDLKNGQKDFEYLSNEINIKRTEKEPLVFQFIGKSLVKWIENKAIRQFDLHIIIKSTNEPFENMMIIKNHFQDFLNFVSVEEVNIIHLKACLVGSREEYFQTA